ncbi:WXG100 family type VII secretion target [Holdemania massiliensis]|uniref:WXG100 family type VII secretion target n=1 Tax=Holdemania massiliensis TaxID=1468449 RepID=UPI00031FA578|nr:WXG100 family type VII secretion target [Holdemania massiliensis]
MAGMGTELTTSKMKEVVNHLSEQVKSYDKAVARLYEIGEEMDTMWEGEASNKFKANLGNDRSRFNALTTMLNRYIEVLTQDIQTYAQAESEAIQIIASNRK